MSCNIFKGTLYWRNRTFKDTIQLSDEAGDAGVERVVCKSEAGTDTGPRWSVRMW